MRKLLLAAVAPLALLAACQTAGGPATSQTALATEPPAASPYGMFLAGEGALNEGRTHDAERFFDAARQGEAGEATIAERDFTAALLAGDVERAAAIAPTGDDASEAAKRLGKLVVAVKTFADGDGKTAEKILSGDAINFPHRAAAALLAPWAAAEAGDVEGSLVRPLVRGDRVVDYFGELDQGLLFERAHRFDEAETDFKAATAGAARSEMGVLAYGGFLERRGRRTEAIALYQQALDAEPASPALHAALVRAKSGKAAPAAPTIREGAAQALLAPAAVMMSAKQNQIAMAYLRLALKLDPNKDEAWVMVGDMMDSAGDRDAARAAYARIKPASPEYIAAQSKLAWTYQSAGDKPTALKIARAIAATGDDTAKLTLADLLRSDDQYAEAASLLTQLIASSKTPDWRLLYARGVSYERLNQWPQAQADLQAALKLHPDDPELLNYLGYSWIDRGEHLKDALAMVEKAVASDPHSGAMVDSLGWAYYRLGDYKKAVDLLEQAVELDAGDPEINNHLGDAYWRVGRRDEAQFQWKRVLTLQPDDKMKSGAEAKLASGLGPDGPQPKLAEH